MCPLPSSSHRAFICHVTRNRKLLARSAAPQARRGEIRSLTDSFKGRWAAQYRGRWLQTHWRSRNILAREEHSRFETQVMNFLKNAAVVGCLLFFSSPSFISLRFFDQQITYGPTIEAGAKGDHNV
jgi:hypothetical protein